jgi:hypothetical protein
VVGVPDQSVGAVVEIDVVVVVDCHERPAFLIG